MPAREAAERSLARAVVGVNKTAGTALLARIRPADHLHPDPGVAPGGARAPVLRTVASRTWRCSSSGSANRRKSHLAVLELRFCEPSQVAPGGARAPVLRTVASRTWRCSSSGSEDPSHSKGLRPSRTPVVPTVVTRTWRCSCSGSEDPSQLTPSVLQLRFCEPSQVAPGGAPAPVLRTVASYGQSYSEISHFV